MKGRLAAALAAVAVVAVFFGVLPVGGAEAYDNEYPFSSLRGTWKMSGGSGTIQADGRTGTMSLRNGTVEFSSLSANGSDSGGSATVKLKSEWKLSSGGSSIDYPLDFRVSGAFTNLSSNAYGVSYASGTETGTSAVTLTSATSGTVTQTETSTDPSNSYVITFSYSITKTSDNVDDDDDDSGGCSAGWGVLALAAAVPLFLRKRK